MPLEYHHYVFYHYDRNGYCVAVCPMQFVDYRYHVVLATA